MFFREFWWVLHLGASIENENYRMNISKQNLLTRIEMKRKTLKSISEHRWLDKMPVDMNTSCTSISNLIESSWTQIESTLEERRKAFSNYFLNGKIISLTLWQTGHRSTTLTVTVPFGPLTEIDRPQRLLLFGLPFGVCGSKSGAAMAQTNSPPLLWIPQAPRPANK